MNFKSLPTSGAPLTKYVASTVACTLTRLQGYFTGTADKWLQVHDSAAEPAANAVPVLSYQLSYNAPFSWGFDPGRLTLTKGCFVCVSDNQEKYVTTTASATVYCSFEGETGPYDFKPADYSVAGDLTSNADSLQVWANVAGPKTIYQIDYINNEATTCYLLLFTDDGATITPALRVWKVPAGETVSLSFGVDGLVPNLRDGSTNTVYNGCTLVQSTTTDPIDVTSGSTSKIQAYYK